MRGTSSQCGRLKLKIWLLTGCPINLPKRVSELNRAKFIETINIETTRDVVKNVPWEDKMTLKTEYVTSIIMGIPHCIGWFQLSRTQEIINATAKHFINCSFVSCERNCELICTLRD